MTRLEYLFRQYDTLLGWYRQSEDKARFLVTLNTLVVGAVNGLVFVGADHLQAVRSSYSTALWLTLGACGAALLGSYLYVLRAMWPRHHAGEASMTPDERLWFFGDIAGMSRETHREAMAGWSEARLETTLVAQNHTLSRNVWIKHEALNIAIALSILAYILLFALGFLYAITVVGGP